MNKESHEYLQRLVALWKPVIESLSDQLGTTEKGTIEPDRCGFWEVDPEQERRVRLRDRRGEHSVHKHNDYR